MLKTYAAVALLLLAAACSQTSPPVAEPVVARGAQPVVRPKGVDPACQPGTSNPCQPETVRQRGSRNVTIIVPGVDSTGHAGF